MFLQAVEKHSNDLVDFLMHPERMEVHHLVILSIAAGYALSSFMAAIPHYVRPLCRYVLMMALVISLRADIIEVVPDHGDLFAGINDALREVAK